MIEKITDAEVKSLWIQRLPDAPNRGGRYGTRGIYFVFAPCSVEDAAELARGLKV